MDSSAQTLDLLRSFRGSLYRCFDRRADALFDLTDALLTAGTVPSPVHLSLAPLHRRGWGSFYAALSRGRIGEDSLRELLALRASVGDGNRPRVYAVDVSVWDRCDAEASPGRGYYYHPSRHSAGQPIVAGWAYQLVAGLSFERDSWVTPLDARRVRPEEDANDAAVEQVWGICWAACRTRVPRPCSSSTPATIPSSSNAAWKAAAPTCWCGGIRTAPSTPPQMR